MRIPIPLKDGDYAPEYETLQKTFWLHCRHTSVTYIERMVEMLESFTRGFEAYVQKDTDPGSFARFLRVCYSDLGDFQEGLARLRRADHTGFKLIRGAMSFRDPFYIRVNDWDFDALGYNGYDKPGVALWSWMEKLIPMSIKIQGALGGLKSYPLFDVSQFNIPDEIGGYPLPHDVFIKDGDDIPTTGVWQPKNLKGGCPNFFIQGNKAPKAMLPTLRYDTSAYVDKQGVEHPAHSDFDLGEFPAVWQLVWEDDRWRNGRKPIAEYEYLNDPTTELPKDPPVALRDPPRFR
jgi:hypothetical protein